MMMEHWKKDVQTLKLAPAFETVAGNLLGGRREHCCGGVVLDRVCATSSIGRSIVPLKRGE